MSDITTTTATANTATQLALPVAAIICIAIGAYLVVIVLILAIRSVLLSRGVCGGSCRCLGKEGEPCCDTCCAELGDCCNCCGSPNFNACLDSICPSRKGLDASCCASCGVCAHQMDCADIVTCQCCADNQCCTCCNSQQPLCDCGQCSCHCNCKTPECEEINFCCCQCQQKLDQYPIPSPPPPGYPSQGGVHYSSPPSQAYPPHGGVHYASPPQQGYPYHGGGTYTSPPSSQGGTAHTSPPPPDQVLNAGPPSLISPPTARRGSLAPIKGPRPLKPGAPRGPKRARDGVISNVGGNDAPDTVPET